MNRVWMLAAACLALTWAAPARAQDDAQTGTASAPHAAASWDTCANCHADVVRTFTATPHAASPAGCQGCHGPTDAHVEGGGDVSKIRRLSQVQGRERADVCLTCHQKGQVAHWAGSVHDTRSMDCLSCHNPHPKTMAPPPHLLRASEIETCGTCHQVQKAKLFRSAHMPVREERMACSSCHNPHGTLNERNLIQHSVNENCYACHADKRGPMLWEHPPVRENCVTCHDPHGSIQPSMLKVKVPLLCQNCHVSSRHPSQTHMATERFAFAQGCNNCHGAIHGSNHPSGNFLLR